MNEETEASTASQRAPAPSSAPPPAIDPARSLVALVGDVLVALTSDEPSLEEMLTRCCDAVVRQLGVALARIWTLDDAGAWLHLRASAGETEHIEEAHKRIAVGSFIVGTVARDRKPYVSNDAVHDRLFMDPAWAARERMVGLAGFPLLVGGRVVGVLGLFTRTALSGEALAALSSITNAVALGIERRRAELARHASERRYAQLLDSVSDAVFCQGPDLAVTYANRAARACFALDDADHAGTAPTHPEADRTVFATGQPAEVLEHPVPVSGEAPRIFHTIKSPVRDHAGHVVELVGVARDVTEPKRSAELQRVLSEASALLASTLDYEETLANVARLAVPTFADWCSVDLIVPGEKTPRRLAVAHKDPAKVEYAHELYKRFPYDADAPYGLPSVLREARTELIADVPDALLVATIPDPELLAIARSLGLRSSICAPLVAHDRVLGAISFVNAESGRGYTPADVALAEELARRAATAIENARLYAEVRALLREREETLATLEQRVIDRTAQLLDANRELEAFSYTVSHDLRAPIRHMSGFLDLLQRYAGASLDEKAQRYVRTIGEAARQMGTLIDALLGFSRMGRAELSRGSVDLDAALAHVRSELDGELQGRDVEWKTEPLGSVPGDATLLRLALANLVGNAVKYTRTREKARIELGLAEGKLPGEKVLYVRDNGVGFNMDYVHKLFGVFQRLHGPDRFEGTGIGLANVRRIVQRHGGRAWAEGVEDKGATFFIALPTGAEADAATQRGQADA